MKKHIWIFILILIPLKAVQAGINKPHPDSILVADSSVLPGEVTAKSIPMEYNIAGENVKAFVSSFRDKYPIQLGAFRFKFNADAFYREVVTRIDRNAIMLKEDGLYKIRITGSPVPEKGNKQELAEQDRLALAEPQDSIYNSDTLTTALNVSDTSGVSSGSAESEITSEQAKSGHIIFISNDNPWIKRVHYFGKSIAFVNALIITIIVSIASMLMLLVFILMNRRRMEREARLHQYLLEKYQGLIVDYLFGTVSADDFRPIASDNYRRQVLIDEMIDVSINLKGEEAKKLLSLYKHLGLDRDSLARANSLRWHKKIKGFRELAFMNIRKVMMQFIKLSIHRMKYSGWKPR